jgi:hypothetical protein
MTTANAKLFIYSGTELGKLNSALFADFNAGATKTTNLRINGDFYHPVKSKIADMDLGAGVWALRKANLKLMMSLQLWSNFRGQKLGKLFFY